MKFSGLDRKVAHIEGVLEGAPELHLIVPFTSQRGAQAALNGLRPLAHGLDVNVRIIAVQSIPFAVPLDEPPIAESYLANSLRSLDCEYPVQREIYLTREPELTWQRVLSAKCVIVIAEPGIWLRFVARRLGRVLESQGHQVCRVR